MIKRIILASLILIVTAVFVLIPVRAESASSGAFSITVTVPLGTTAEIITPGNGQTCSQTPTITGTTTFLNEAVEIKGTSAGSEVVVATTFSDSNGNFAVEVNSGTSLSLGANTLTPYVDGSPGTGTNVVVNASLTTNEEPIITSPIGGKIKVKRPTITGLALAGETAMFYSKNSSGTIIQMGQETVSADGTFLIIPSSDFTPGVHSIYVVVNKVASAMVSVTFVDPYGVVYDSETNESIEGVVLTIQRSLDGGLTWFDAVAGSDIAAIDVNPQTTGADGAYSYLTVNGDFKLLVSKNGYTFPSTIIPMGSPNTGSHGELFSVAGVILNIDLPMDFSGASLLKIKKDVNKKDVVVGDIVTYTVTIINEGASDVTNVYLKDKLAGGLKYLEGKVLLDGNKIPDPTGTRTKTFNIGTVPAGSSKTLKYQVVVGSGVTFGNYENKAWCEFSNGRQISNSATETVKVIPESLFDLGTVIGKVFWDRNENGIQDPSQSIGGQVIGEEPIPNAQIATEDGTLITTDKDGKYHLPAIIPGRHILRIDERTLPEGAYLTTDKAVIIDITPGILSKVNFGVNCATNKEHKLSQAAEIVRRPGDAKIIHERIKPQPRLNASLFKEELIFKENNLIEPAEFRIFTNYFLFIDKWKLEILDKDAKNIVKKFEGLRLTINAPIYWDGKDKNEKALSSERNYVYVLTVTGKDGRQDVIRERGLVVREQKTGDREEKSEREIEKEKQRWIEQENQINNLEKQNIKVEGEIVKVSRPLGFARDGSRDGASVEPLTSEPVTSIRILKSGELKGEIPIFQPQSLTPSELLESPKRLEAAQGETTVDIILPKGEYDIQVIPQSSETRSQMSAYSKHIKVGEEYFFFVGMGDAKMGYTFNRGNIEPIQHDDKFKEGFWSEGKMAYYLKGKIKGKYLITLSLDTERDKKELFKNLEPDKYYSVYGDSSSVNYDATNTQGPLYLLVEWDKSSAIWGNYNTAFTDTEFAAFNRTLYGGKLYYESVSATQFGEPRTKLIVFNAHAKQRAAHNEFIGTGGSLFYLKNKDVIKGSDKVKIEVRDKLTGLVLTSKEMEEGVDYEIDYPNGRLIFWQPVAYIVESDSIISSHLLNGNPVYVVVDYEYETKDKYDQETAGARIQQSLTDYLRVGGTYVKEEQLDKNYELRGTDTILHLGKDITLTGEYAESESEAQGGFISTDGGLSFTELATADLDKGKAYGLKAEAHLFDRLGLTSYYKQIEKGFSSAATTSQTGKELIGAGATFDVTQKTRLKVSHDIQKLIDDGNLQTQLQVGAKKTETTSAQLQHEVVTDKLKFTGEYRHQKVIEKKEQFESETNTEEDIAAIRADYKATDKVTVSLEQQATLKGAPNHQTTAGIEAKITEKVSLRAKETVGTQGTATGVGVTTNVKDRFEVSSDYTRTNYKTGGVSDTASLSGKAKVDEKTQVHTTLAVTDSSEGGQTQSLVFGTERKVNEELTLAGSKSYAKSRDNLTQANTYGLTKEKDGKKLEGTFTEQKSRSSTEVSNTNIFGLSGDINDKWAAQGSFERGIVQNHSGSQATRNAGSIGLGFVDKDKQTQEVRLKASSKLELRLDDGQEEKRQFLIYNAIEGKINPNTTLFAKANISQTKNTTTNLAEAQYKELVTGAAYRPVNFDRLNLLGKYTYLEDDSPSGQSDFSDIEKEKSHTLAGEAVYDLTDKWQLVEKLAYKQGEEKVTGFDFTKTQTWLIVHRLNYNIDRNWQVGAEYRRLTQKQAKDYKQGALVEVSRKIGEFIQVGAGYNFTDFNDDLTHLDYKAQGPFVRLTAKFYDRTPKEIERAREKWLESMIKLWAWELVNEELAKPDSPIMQELCNYFYLAEDAQKKMQLKESEKYYETFMPRF